MKRLTPAVATLIASLLLPAAAQPDGPVVDGHTHQGLRADGEELHTAGLDELRKRGFQIVIHALPVDRSMTGDLFGRLVLETERLRRAARGSDDLYLVDDPRALLASPIAPGVGLLFAMEWFGPTFDGDASRAVELSELGVHIFGPPDEDPDGLFLTGEQSNRLSPFGRQILGALEAAGVVVDLTHLSHARKLAVIAASSAPTVVSHGNVRAAADLPFNLPDELLEALAANGGQVWVSFNRNGVLETGEDDSSALPRLIDHIEVLAGRLGSKQVGIGTDLQADGRYVPEPLYRQDTLARLRSGLLERGFTPQEVDGILGGNVLRLLVSGRRPGIASPTLAGVEPRQ
jgi:hypothetical protein